MADDQLAFEATRAAVIAEFEYVSSLIPLYRGFEMQAMRLAILILTATAVFIASAIEVRDTDNALLALAFVPGLMAGLLFALGGMEVRIIRASRYIERTLAPRMKRLAGQDVFEFERAPGAHLSDREVSMTGTSVYTTILLVPGISAGVAAASIKSSAFSTPKTIVALVGLILLTVAAMLVHATSAAHERRGRRSSKRRRFLRLRGSTGGDGPGGLQE